MKVDNVLIQGLIFSDWFQLNGFLHQHLKGSDGGVKKLN
jgi:hypothetical protein